MVRRYRFCALFVVLAVALTVVCSGMLAAAATPYTDPQGHFSFTVPDGWQQVAPPTNVTLPSGTQFVVAYSVPTLNTNNVPANMNIVTTTVPAGTTLDQVVSAGVAALPQSVPGYQAGTGGVQRVTLGGQPAETYQFTITPSGQSPLSVTQVVSLIGTTAYVITFTASQADSTMLLQQGSTLLSTFQFTGTTAVAPAAPAPTATTPSSSPAATVPAPAASVAPPPTRAPTVTIPVAPPSTGGGGETSYLHRLGDG